MATTQYIGARYVPRHMGEWDVNTQYGALDVVLYTDGNSYTAKCFPPKGTIPTNDQYWALSAQFNQQLASVGNRIVKLEKATAGFVNIKDSDNWETDFGLALMELFNTGNRYIFIPDGDYTMKTQVVIPENSVVMFSKGALVTSEYTGDSVVFSGPYSRIENMKLKGTDTGTGVVCSGYQTSMVNCNISNFGTGLLVQAVGFTCESSQVTNCDTGIQFKRRGEPTSYTSSTMVLFINCFVNHCRVVGVKMTSQSTQYGPECFNLTFDTCAFESNQKSVDISVTTNRLKFVMCWFENNTAEGNILANSLIWEMNRFENGDPKINFNAVTRYAGCLWMDNGEVRANKFKIYHDNDFENPVEFTFDGISAKCAGEYIVRQDKNKTEGKFMVNSKTNKVVASLNMPFIPTVSNEGGEVTIDWGSRWLIDPIITVEAYNGLQSEKGCTKTTVKLSNVDAGSYNDYFIVSKIVVKAENEDGVIPNPWICININYDKFATN